MYFIFDFIIYFMLMGGYFKKVINYVEWNYIWVISEFRGGVFFIKVLF